MSGALLSASASMFHPFKAGSRDVINVRLNELRHQYHLRPRTGIEARASNVLNGGDILL